MKRTAYLILIVFTTPLWLSAPVQAENDDPLPAVQQYLTAYFTRDADGVEALTCAGELDTLDPDTLFDPLIAAVESFTFTADPSELEYEFLRQGEGWAEVHISGSVTIEVPGLHNAPSITPEQAQIDPLWAVVEDGAWKICRHPSGQVLEALDPAAVAKLFYEAAFSGDYDTAHVLICTEQQDQLSRAEFNAVFSDFVEGKTQVDLSAVTFEITEQTAKTAVVTLHGLVSIQTQASPHPLQIEAGQMSLGPVSLIREQRRWKICQPDPVES